MDKVGIVLILALAWGILSVAIGSFFGFAKNLGGRRDHRNTRR